MTECNDQGTTPATLTAAFSANSFPATLASRRVAATEPGPTENAPSPGAELPAFFPDEPESFEQAGLSDALVESLVFKHLFSVGSNTGRGMARDLCIPVKSTIELLTTLKNRQLVVYKGSASMGDFQYVLTDGGRERAVRCLEECTYNGPAPVPFNVYVESVHAQSIAGEQPGPGDLRQAFGELLLRAEILEQLGPAVNSGRGLFLYGNPGNGKTSIAERITRCFGTQIWIPRALFIDGEIVLLFDPQSHEIDPSGRPSLIRGRAHDPRWVKIKRPTIVVGGELTLDSLELQYNPYTKITEPPIQLKSNCGTLVIDDFGRQRVPAIELLNRWIVPLEKRIDYLTLHNGKKLQVPFDQLIVFSTNLEPRELVDDAFLRRIPYKINIPDPSEEEFRALMQMTAAKLDVPCDDDCVDRLIQKHYRATKRGFRCCHPRDLILQLLNQARYHGSSAVMSDNGFDLACGTYFSLL